MALVILRGGPMDSSAVHHTLFNRSINRFVVRITTYPGYVGTYVEPPSQVIPPEENSQMALYFPNGDFDRSMDSHELFQEMATMYRTSILRDLVSRN